MQKPIIFTVAALSILLFAFAPQTRSVQKVAEEQYTVAKSTTFNKADQAQLKNMIQKYYKVTDFNKVTRLSPIAGADKVGSWFVDNSVYKDFITIKFISWKLKTQVPEVAQIKTVLQRYQ